MDQSGGLTREVCATKRVTIHKMHLTQSAEASYKLKINFGIYWRYIRNRISLWQKEWSRKIKLLQDEYICIVLIQEDTNPSLTILVF